MRRFFFLPLIIALSFTLLNGCATTGTNGGSEKGIDADIEKTTKIDKPSIKEFIIGVGDTINISVYRQDDLNKSIKIDPSGKIMFPLIGDVDVAGKGIFSLRKELRERLSEYIVDPQITINVTSVGSQKIMVIGEVAHPGIFTLDTEYNIMEAIAEAGGGTNDAKLSNVILIRSGQKGKSLTTINLKKTFKEGMKTGDIMLRNGDIVYVPEVTIAKVSWYVSHIGQILSPVVNLGSGIVIWDQALGVFHGSKKGSLISISNP